MVRDLDVLRELEQVRSLRPDLTAERCQDLYRTVCDQDGAPHGHGNWDYAGRVDLTVVGDEGAASYHATDLFVPLFEVPEFEAIVARIAELAPPPTASDRESLASGLPASRDKMPGYPDVYGKAIESLKRDHTKLTWPAVALKMAELVDYETLDGSTLRRWVKRDGLPKPWRV